MSVINRPNYFILLELDPQKPWSEEEYNQALKNKKTEWTKQFNHPQKKAAARKNAEMIPKIEALMKNKSERQKEAAEAIKIKSGNEQDTRAAFSETLKLFTSKGYITEDEITQLLKEYSSVTNNNELRKELKNKGIEVRQQIAETAQQEDVLKPSLMIEIKTNLEIINKKDLYDFLELEKSTRTSDLLEKANRIYEQCLKTGGKTTEVTVKGDLAGKAATIFKNDFERAKYDRALALEAFSILDEQIRKLAVRADRTIYATEFTYLLDIARSNGLDVDKATNHIRKAASEKKLAVEVAGIEAVKQKIRCLSCDRLNEKEREFCIECNAPLKVTCPKCKQVSPIENRVCQCSFPIGNATNVRNLIAESQGLITEKVFEGAVVNLQYATQLWNTIPPVQLKDELTKTIEQYLQEAQRNQQQQQALQNKLRQAIQDRRFYEARTLLVRLQSDFSQLSLAQESSIIDREIKQAETTLSKVRTSNLEGEEAIALYQQILWNCKDCQSALEALAKTPPAPPKNLQASVGNRLVSLNWQSSPAKNINYTIIRKYGARPVSSNDGEALATVAGTHYDDTQPAMGLPIYYAVYTNREGVLSASAAVLSTPVLAIGEVEKLLKQVSDRQVNLQWTPPPMQ
jgi:hypothetical protein